MWSVVASASHRAGHVPKGDCGGFERLQSLYVANNVCSAVEYFRKLGGNVGVAGMVTNKDDGAGQAQAFCKAVGIPELASIPAHDDIRRKSASYEIIGRPDGEWGSLFSDLATNVQALPQPEPLTQDGLELFDGDTVGRDVVLQPASLEDLCIEHLNKPSLEVIYDSVQRIAVDSENTAQAVAARGRRGDARRCGGGQKCAAGTVRPRDSQGPHDQPQSMCPALPIASGLRMRRTATVLSGSPVVYTVTTALLWRQADRCHAV